MSEQEKMPDIRKIFEEMGKREKAQKVERFRRLNPLAKKGQVLFAGSSLMEQFPIGELLMSRGLGRWTVYNRGIGGYTTAELEETLEECVFALEPKYIFINIGTNDMNGPDYTLEGLMERYSRILEKIRARLPEAEITLLAYYPLCEPVLAADPMMSGILQHRNNRVIAQANRRLPELAEKYGASFVDCNAGIVDEQGNMRREFTIEGMHMYADGYDRVLDALMERLEKIFGE